MEENKTTNQTNVTPESEKSSGTGRNDNRGRGRGQRPGGRRKSNFKKEPKDNFKEKVIDLRRVTRVVAGGKRFRFRATLVVGDGMGNVGVGVAKGADVQAAIEKSRRDAKRNIIKVAFKGRTIPHEVTAKFSAAKVLIRPAEAGHGLKAGGAMRTVLALAGIQDITAKSMGRTKNKLTNALATIEALKQLKTSK
ncbi:30S ribosomal protein S5 [Candidatus Wolfebacteria bacterium]|nr:30S ribosomal protein S5 [Candidatus Wolfebacteria bacterium]